MLFFGVSLMPWMSCISGEARLCLGDVTPSLEIVSSLSVISPELVALLSMLRWRRVLLRPLFSSELVLTWVSFLGEARLPRVGKTVHVLGVLTLPCGVRMLGLVRMLEEMKARSESGRGGTLSLATRRPYLGLTCSEPLSDTAANDAVGSGMSRPFRGFSRRVDPLGPKNFVIEPGVVMAVRGTKLSPSSSAKSMITSIFSNISPFLSGFTSL